MGHRILSIANKKDEAFLRKETKSLVFSPDGTIFAGESRFTKKELSMLIKEMKRTMKQANGIGLSANQIGLSCRLFVAQVSNQQGEMKFYAVLNPKIEKISAEKVLFEEGCLSVPGTWGTVSHPANITISGLDKNGRPVKIKAWGLLGFVFQHEIDHLNGKLFIDRTKDIRTIPVSERLKKREVQ